MGLFLVEIAMAKKVVNWDNFTKLGISLRKNNTNSRHKFLGWNNNGSFFH